MSQKAIFYRWALAAWLIFSQLAALTSLLLWLGLAGMSLLAFDAGVSLQASLFVGLVWAYPLLPLALAVWSWLAFRAQRKKRAFLLGLVQFLLIGAMALFFFN